MLNVDKNKIKSKIGKKHNQTKTKFISMVADQELQDEQWAF